MINTRIKHANDTQIIYIKNTQLKTIIKNTVTATDHDDGNNRVGGNGNHTKTMDEEVNKWETPAYLQRRRRGGHSSPLINHHITTAAAPIQPTRGTQNMYFEPEQQSRCMVHSINMFVGYRWLDAHAVAVFCDAVKNVDQWSQAWTTSNGSMNVHAMNYYLMHNTTPRIGNDKELKFLNKSMSDGESREKWLEAIGDRHEVLLHRSVPYGHAVCLKNYEGMWYLLDSETRSKQPIPLDTPARWGELRGTLLVLTTREEHEQQQAAITMTIDDDDAVTETHGHTANNNATNNAMEVEEQTRYQQACMQDQEMREDTKCIPPPQHATAPAVTTRAPRSMQQKKANPPKNKAPVSLKPNGKETKVNAQNRPRKNKNSTTRLQTNEMANNGHIKKATTKKIHDYFKFTSSSAATQDTDMQGTATNQAQITEDELQHDTNKSNMIPPIEIITEFEKEKQQPPPPNTKSNAAKGKVKTKSKNRARNNQAPSTFSTWLKNLTTALYPKNIMANNVEKNNADKNEAPTAVLPLPIPSENEKNSKSYEQTTTEQTHTSDFLKTLTWNCRNLRLNSESLLLLVQKNKPDIIFLTETHYLPKQHNHLGPLRDGLRDYHLTLSSFNALPAKSSQNQGAGKLYPRAKAGVLLAVRKNLVPAGCDITRHPTPPELSGYYTSTTITPPHGPTTYLATAYVCPSNVELRNHMYNHIAKSADAPHCQGIIGGDWNATLFPTDRSCTTMNHTDKIHTKFVNENRLSPLATRHQTESVFTYFSETDTINASRIDDAYYFILNNNTTRAPPPPAPVKGATENITLSDGNSDHRPVVHTIPRNSCLCLPRYDNNENPNNINKAHPKMRFQKITEEGKQIARTTLLADHSSLAHKTRENTCKAVEIAMQALDGNHSPQNRVAAQKALQEAGLTIDDQAEEVIDAINTCHQSIIEKQIWEQTPVNPKGKGMHAPRKLSGETQKSATSKKATQTAMTHVIQAKAKATLYAKNITTNNLTDTQKDGNISQTQGTPENYLDDCLHAHTVEQWPLTYNDIARSTKNLISKLNKNKENSNPTDDENENDNPCWPLPSPPPNPYTNKVSWEQIDEWTKECQKHIRACSKKISSARNDTAKAEAKAINDKKRHILNTRTKTGNRMIAAYGQDTEHSGPPKALRNSETNKIETQAKGVLEITEQHFSDLLSDPVGEPKTGNYFNKSNRPKVVYPFEKPEADDPFELTSPAKKDQDDTPFMLTRMMDYDNIFNECLRNLGKNKLPGPDGIINELLQVIPDDLKHALHNLYIIMWIAEETPACMKNSSTILLYKKGDPLVISNYRPIGLLNTTCKLWTSMISTIMHEYCEHHHIISTCQEGFMARRNTIRQLTLMILTLQDAALTGKNIYTAYIDFSSAFNTINHDKCFQIMYDLGIPEDAIKNVRHLYSNATTSVEIPGMGTTCPIPIRQGTIQGDTLSPLMFNIYLEPLLRWLQVGGRGYTYGCLQGDNTTSIKHACASLAYADDLAIMTSNLNHMKIQATKVDQYCTWSNLKVVCKSDKPSIIIIY